MRIAVLAALVKLHNYIRAEVFLDRHNLFRRKQMRGAVYMRIEIYPFVADFIQLCQRKYLKAAAVRQNRSVPIHKFVQTARLFYKLVIRAQI